jgi:hypothetical protein
MYANIAPRFDRPLDYLPSIVLPGGNKKRARNAPLEIVLELWLRLETSREDLNSDATIRNRRTIYNCGSN